MRVCSLAKLLVNSRYLGALGSLRTVFSAMTSQPLQDASRTVAELRETVSQVSTTVSILKGRNQELDQTCEELVPCPSCSGAPSYALSKAIWYGGVAPADETPYHMSLLRTPSKHEVLNVISLE